MNTLCITRAHEHNLKNISLSMPRSKLISVAGVSGSGKSSLVFDIIAREGQRQYFESVSSYSRRYLSRSNRASFDSIEGLSPTIIISQDRVLGNPRSTVGTLTEAYTYLRLLFSRVGLPSMDSSHYSFNHPHGACQRCKGLGKTVQVDLDKLLDRDKSLAEGAIKVRDWKVGGRMWKIVKGTGYFLFDKKIKDFGQKELDLLLYAPPRLIEQEDAFLVNRWTYQGVVHRMMHRNTKVHRGPSQSDLQYLTYHRCPECQGARLNPDALRVRINGLHIGHVAAMPLTECLKYLENIAHPLAAPILPLLTSHLTSLIAIGLGYLSLDRSTSTLSGGEAQRVKMARQLHSNLVEMIYVLDEPSAGLHPRDINKLIDTLKGFRDHNNTVLVVEHDTSILNASDHIIEIGPGGGKKGGTIVAEGPPQTIIANPQSRLAPYLTQKFPIKKHFRRPTGSIMVRNARLNNLCGFTVRIPTGVLVALTGVSGSGKSSLVQELCSQHPNKSVIVNQQPIGTTKRGCLATYVGVFDYIRKLFARHNAVSTSLFSFNGGGACTECKGLGHIPINMHFLGDITVPCSACNGLRYRPEALTYPYKGKNIAKILAMTAEEAYTFFTDTEVRTRLTMLMAVGLDYLQLGQTLNTLSGGESQRLKIANRLTQHGSLYIFDEPSSGLHPLDVCKLLTLFDTLIEQHNSLVVVEHNLQVIGQADWIIDLGPGGGPDGGRVIAQGTPTHVATDARSSMSRFL